MKKLKFLFASSYSQLAVKLIGYIVERGHNIDFVETNISEQKKSLDWLRDYTYHLNIIDNKNIDYSKYDYLIDLDNLLSLTKADLAKLCILVNLDENLTLHLSIIICSENICKSIIEKVLLHFKQDLDYLYNEITELFIDGLLVIFRCSEKYENIGGNTVTYSSCTNSLSELINLEYKLNELHAYYKQMENHTESIFLPSSLFNPASVQSLKKVKSTIKLDITNNDVELLVVYLLMLLNGRKQAIYKYDFSDKYDSYLTNYLELCPTDTYSLVRDKLYSHMYGLLDNKFFKCVGNHFQHSEILFKIKTIDIQLSYDDKYLIVVEYDIINNELFIYYHPELYFFELIDTYIEYFNCNLKQWLHNNDNIGSTLYSSHNLYHRELYEWNDTAMNYPDDKTIHELFEEQVLRNPNNIALVFEDTSLSYYELNKRANQLASYLRVNYKIQPDQLITCFLSRSEYIIIAILAILKSGGAYVPIDPAYPDKRIKYIMQDTQTAIVLANDTYRDRLNNIITISENSLEAISVLLIDDSEFLLRLQEYSVIDSSSNSRSNNLAYVIYTSGTTGKPKGVMVEHKNLVNFVLYQKTMFSDRDIISGCINYSFDAANTEIFSSLLLGKLLHLVNDITRIDVDMLLLYVKKHNITVVILPAFVAAELLSNLDILQTNLRLVVVGGEIYYGNLQIEKLKIINAFGPTEGTVCTTIHTYKKNDLRTNIGAPIYNAKCYVLDSNLMPLPVGVIGELYIGGAGVVRGYLNNPGLTAEKFIINPFLPKPNHISLGNYRMYKTGDLVRWLLNGELEYIGRNDTQAKILGHRIELGEIERRLYAYPGIKQAIVTVRNYKNHKYLVAYYVGKPDVKEINLQNYLDEHLPKYMVPSKIIKIDKVPLTINGKLDQTQLPVPDFTTGYEFVIPSTTKEKLVCDVFAEVLGVDKVGINDSFYSLGGNSFAAVRVTLKLQNHLEVKLSDILTLRTPKQIAAHATVAQSTLKDKLEKIKQTYAKQHLNGSDYNKLNMEDMSTKVSNYLHLVNNTEFDSNKIKPITNILLTGATGYLGCNLLHQLLISTKYKVYLLIRAQSDELAYQRIYDKFSYYFKLDLNLYKDRIVVCAADIEYSNLSLSFKCYQNLVVPIDCIIHAAASVKHYGNYDEAYKSNVQATINLLELARQNKIKDFHYISTTAPLVKGNVLGYSNYIFDETDDANIVAKNGIYSITKFEAEQIVAKYRDYGVNTNIYRIGNLAFMVSNNCVQQNLEDNAFYQWVKCLVTIKCVAKQISEVDISPADMVAQAIIMLFDKTQLINTTFHVFNPYKFNLATIVIDDSYLFESLSIANFIDHIVQHLDSEDYNIIERFLLHQGWLDDIPSCNTIEVLQDKTQFILNKCGFNWYPIANSVFVRYLESVLRKNSNGKTT